VYPFDRLDEIETAVDGDWDAVRGLLGGKGANLAEMTRLGIPVPPGFTITAQACLAYLDRGHTLPAEGSGEPARATADVEGRSGAAVEQGAVAGEQRTAPGLDGHGHPGAVWCAQLVLCGG